MSACEEQNRGGVAACWAVLLFTLDMHFTAVLSGPEKVGQNGWQAEFFS